MENEAGFCQRTGGDGLECPLEDHLTSQSKKMNPIGIHFGYWTQYWNSDPIDFVARAKKCGFDVLEINAPKVTLMGKAERDKLKGAAADAGLTLTYSIGMTADMDLVSEDTAIRDKGITFLQDVSKAMKYMGGRVMAGINYSSWPRKLFPGEEKQVLTERAVAGVKEAIKAAEDNDVLFCVEVVNRFEQFMMNTAEEGVAFAERVGSPNCKILLDTFHMNIEEDSFRGSIQQAGQWLGHFHLGESNRRPPGEGRLPWPEIFGALREINYQGAVVMEPFLLPGGDVGRDISVFRDLLGKGDLDEKVTRSVQFVRDQQS
jgi:D-psicose/D-tagatose/L-ribulose 3-epimerase